MWIDTLADSGRVPERKPHGGFNHFYEVFLLVSFGQLLQLPGSQSIFSISQGLPMCALESLSQVEFY